MVAPLVLSVAISSSSLAFSYLQLISMQLHLLMAFSSRGCVQFLQFFDYEVRLCLSAACFQFCIAPVLNRCERVFESF